MNSHALLHSLRIPWFILCIPLVTGGPLAAWGEPAAGEFHGTDVAYQPESMISGGSDIDPGADRNAPPPAEYAANLIVNGGFEDGDYTPDSEPTGWRRDAWLAQEIIMTWDATESRSGEKSVKIHAPTNNDARWLQTSPVVPNTVYFLSGSAKTQNVAHDDRVDAGANLCLHGEWLRTEGVFGTQDWTPISMLFNSGSREMVEVGARLGFWSGDITGTAWFDDVGLERILPIDPHPVWKILVLIYAETDLEATDSKGVYHHYLASMTADEMERAAVAARDFVDIDIPALSSGNVFPELTVRYPSHTMSKLSRIGAGWWPSPGDTAEDRDPEFDSVIVIWDPRTTDITTGEFVWIGYGDGLAAYRGTQQTYVSMQVDAAVARGHRNVFKHEWGHSILFFYEALGVSPQPIVSNHAYEWEYVNCGTGQPYVWTDETLDKPIPNSIYNNESGFTHDYYSGTAARAEQPTECIGIPSNAWALGGPVSHSGKLGVPTLVASMDVRPGHTLNFVSPNYGLVPVALLSTSKSVGDSNDFDALEVDPTTLRLGRDSAHVAMSSRNVKILDVDGDGDEDLMLLFRAGDTGTRCGDSVIGLVGHTYAGQPLESSDAIRTIFCKP